MKDDKRKLELARLLAHDASSDSLVRNYLDKCTALFKLVLSPDEVKSKHIQVQKLFDSAASDILNVIVDTINEKFTLEELEYINSIMNNPIFEKFNNLWKSKETSDILFAIADKRAARLVRELNELFPPTTETSSALPASGSHLN